MRIYITVLLLPLLMVLVLITNGAFASTCPVERDREMDKCASQMGFLGDKSFKVPKTITQMDQFCTRLKTSLTCIQSYSRQCLTSLSRQVLGTIAKNGKHLQSRICSNNISKQEFMSKLACLEDHKIDQFHNCMIGSVARFEYIASEQVPQEDRIVSICCSGHVFRNDLQKTVTQLCNSATNASTIIRSTGTTTTKLNSNDTATYLHELVGTTLGDFTNLVCDGYQSYGDCQKSKRMTKILPQMENITQLVHQFKIKPKASSLLSVLLVILDDQLGGSAHRSPTGRSRHGQS